MKRKKTEQHFGVPPEVITNRDYFVVHKASKKGQTSFRITKGLLESLIETSIKIQKQPRLVLNIANEYTLTCSLTKAR